MVWGGGSIWGGGGLGWRKMMKWVMDEGKVATKCFAMASWYMYLYMYQFCWFVSLTSSHLS